MKRDEHLDMSLSTLIADKIAEEIISGKLHPGDKLIEGKYAEEFKISRAPVREAFFLLINDGLVERIPRRGTVIKGYSKQEMYDLFEIRLLLENMSLSRIGQTIDPEVLIQIESMISRMEDVVSRVKTSDYATLNTEFHKSLIRLSGSEVIVNLYNRLGTPLKTLQKISFIETKGMEQSLHEHKQIFKALKNGEISLAQSILKHHNQHVIDRIEKAL